MSEEIAEAVEEQAEFDVNPLDDIFPDRHPLEPKGEEVIETPEPPAEEVGTKGVEEAEPPAAKEQTTEDSVLQRELAAFKAKALDEAKKRQALEVRLAQQQQEQPKGFDWDNPDSTIASIEQRFEQRMQTTLLNMSETQAKARHEDYDQKYEVFERMARENPAIVQTMLQQADPAEYAYNMATQKIFTDEIGSNPKEYEDKLRAKIRLELEQEFKQKTDNRQALVDSLPPSAKKLTNKNNPVDVIDDDPLGSLFNDHPS